MLIVQKYGGTSVATIERIRNVAARALATQAQGHQVAVVVSAMAGETNRLLGLAHQIQEDGNDREFDVIVSTGEQVTVGLLALAIRAIGGQARSFLGHQVKIRTDSEHARARIRSIDADALKGAFSSGEIAVIAGFQGIDEQGAITTLGRGGSDTTAVAIAAALTADACEIYTDVDGVYTADPRVVPRARKIARISYEEMMELASLGARVLQIRSVEFGMKYGVPIHVRSSFNDQPGTWVVPEETTMEDVMVAGVTSARDEARITIRGVPHVPGAAGRIFAPLSQAGVVVDMIIQNAAHRDAADGADERMVMTFTVPRKDRKRTIDILLDEVGDICTGDNLSYADDVAKVSIVGVGMRTHAGVAQRMFEILASEGINIHLISTSEIKVSCMIDEKYTELAVRALHDGFGLHRAAGESTPQ